MELIAVLRHKTDAEKRKKEISILTSNFKNYFNSSHPLKYYYIVLSMVVSFDIKFFDHPFHRDDLIVAIQKEIATNI